MPDLRIALSITAETALSVGAAGSAGTLADTSIVRDGMGRPIIPGSQLKGKVRHAAEALVQRLNLPGQAHFDDDESPTNCIRQIFGSPLVRSPLRFADLICKIDPQIARLPGTSRIRPSVTINRRRGTAEDQHLLLRETAREGLIFQANDNEAITGKLPTPAHAALLWAALRLSERWGGAKSRGLGWCTVEATVYWDNTLMSTLQLAKELRALGEQ